MSDEIFESQHLSTNGLKWPLVNRSAHVWHLILTVRKTVHPVGTVVDGLKVESLICVDAAVRRSTQCETNAIFTIFWTMTTWIVFPTRLSNGKYIFTWND